MREIAWPSGDKDTPLYLQLARSLRNHISDGGIVPGGALPSERDLSEMAGLSRVTVRKGIQQLIDEGIVVRKQGSGTFVAPRIEARGARLTSFSDDARSRGEAPGVVWIYKSYALPTEEEAHALAVAPDTRVARLGRVRLSGGDPLAIEHAVVPAEFMPDLAQLQDSLYEALEAHGFRPVGGTQRVRASLATATEAGILSIEQQSEVLRIERCTRLSDGRIVEFTRSVYRGDRYEFVTELNEV
ncbi:MULTISPECIES: GntR family transcriptional regulator [Sphingomonas]|jgi:GntR family transcriptional regulator|uniref:GntR family transcriptional regulator n=1 Tax=Sphingomonas hankookensis TaxID=563996 RepID=A0ABR5YD33_9SPHN|nr:MULTISPECIES: GntR family transcriptional regulator [Sphingomonas]KZE15928.1 GntR family transcriptional regulator [Sphingomonas hankookensis]PZT91268.1 MAG: GntR family transcriptional regulator [Sphingomonas sp.]RSV21412.1 GntR family transcriptional regulator [Sphingomonas sp. ABOLH]WCP73204.1 GntR family transcriptional regulator [Sphingomonas hankookensis]